MSDDVSELIAEARRENRLTLTEADGKAVLRHYGVAVPRSLSLTTRGNAESAFKQLQPPLVLKGMAKALVHKSDAGAVKLNLKTLADVETAMGEMIRSVRAHDIRLDSFLLEEMAGKGVEMVVGGINDRQFGPMVMVGLGGVFVEVFKDVAFRLCPVDRDQARAMLDELQAIAILEGARGGPACDMDAIVDAIVAVGGEGGLMLEHDDEVAELDINPLIVSPRGAVAVDARVVLHAEPQDTSDMVRPMAPDADLQALFDPLFSPKTIGVVGASASRKARANIFMDQCRELGFEGRFYPIHPTADEIEGCKAYRSLADTPEPVDYTYIAIPAKGVPDVLAEANGNARFAHIMSAGFGEVPKPENQRLNDALIAAAKKGGVRLLGPNCNGGYSPRGKLTFIYRGLPEVGTVGVFTQSGGLGIDVIRRGQQRGVRFSGVMTLGNCVDIGPNDLMEFYLADPQTKVIGTYMEGTDQGRRFVALLHEARRRGKPVVILKGGRTEQGGTAAISHTGALAGDARVWQAICRQTGAVMVDTLEAFIDTLLAFQMLEPHADNPTTRASLLGNGGGTSVLAVDAFAETGIDVVPYAQSTIDRLAALGLPPGTSIANPIDAPIGTLVQDEGRVAEKVMRIVYDNEDPQAFVMHANLPVLWTHIEVDRGVDVLENLIESAVRVQQDHPGRCHFLLVLRSDGDVDIDARKQVYRDKALARGIPCYDEMTNAAAAVSAIGWWERALKENAGR